MPTIFVSHSSLSSAKEKAIDFKRLLLDGSSDLRVFLSSDWNSIVAGNNSLQEIERALATHTHFVALLVNEGDAVLPWICSRSVMLAGEVFCLRFSSFRALIPGM
jgi:hypothetical protein